MADERITTKTTLPRSVPDPLDYEDDDWVVCETCGGEGVNGHDCGEDTCCCLQPEENVSCQTCDGEGGWRHPDTMVADG